MLSNAKKGDAVWAVGHGWGIVTLATKTYIHVCFRKDCVDVQYNLNGCEYVRDFEAYDTNCSLFWDEVKIEAPAMPVKLVTFIEAVETLDKGECTSIRRKEWTTPLRNVNGFVKFAKDAPFNCGLDHMLAEDWICE